MVVKFDCDGCVLLLPALEVKDIASGKSAQETPMEEGQPCMAPYGNEVYRATKVYISGKSNLVMKVCGWVFQFWWWRCLYLEYASRIVLSVSLRSHCNTWFDTLSATNSKEWG